MEGLRKAMLPDHKDMDLDPFLTSILSDPDLVLWVFFSGDNSVRKK